MSEMTLCIICGRRVIDGYVCPECNAKQEIEWRAPMEFYNEDHTGLLVITKGGFKGYTKRSDGLYNKKVPVYTEDGGRFLCDPHGLEVIGFYDG